MDTVHTWTRVLILWVEHIALVLCGVGIGYLWLGSQVRSLQLTISKLKRTNSEICNMAYESYSQLRQRLSRIKQILNKEAG